MAKTKHVTLARLARNGRYIGSFEVTDSPSTTQHNEPGYPKIGSRYASYDMLAKDFPDIKVRLDTSIYIDYSTGETHQAPS